MPLFKDRRDAGRVLGGYLQNYANKKNAVILALPRGGIPVAYEIAKALNLPLDVFIVRKIGVPGREELAMGAIASGDIVILNEDVINALKIPKEIIDSVINKENAELKRRESLYRKDSRIDIENKTVILVDDGLATGASMKAAVKALKKLNPGKIVIAVPTSSPETCTSMEKEVDEIICAFTPEIFRGVGEWYLDFSQTGDEEARELLQKAHENINK
jgi:predicted phosphoribosyltransferase